MLDAARRPAYIPRAFVVRRMLRPLFSEATVRVLNLLKSIFTWWNQGTVGLRFTVSRLGRHVGTDEYGNRYFEARDDRESYDKGRKRRWVIFRGYADASKVPAEWHGWLHYTLDEVPTAQPLPRKAWEKDHLPNLTGTVHAWRPKGSIARGGERQAATGDYQAWSPE